MQCFREGVRRSNDRWFACSLHFSLKSFPNTNHLSVVSGFRARTLPQVYSTLPVYGSLLFVIIDLIRCKRNSPNVEAIDSARRVFSSWKEMDARISRWHRNEFKRNIHILSHPCRTRRQAHIFKSKPIMRPPPKVKSSSFYFFFPRFYTYPHIHSRSMLFMCDKCTKFFRQHCAVGIYIVLRLFVSMSMPLYLCASFRVVRPYNVWNFGGSDCWLPLFCDK